MTLYPGDWGSLPLGKAGKWLSGGTPATSVASYWGGDIPWISSGSLTSPRLWDSDRRVTQEGLANGTRLVGPGAILMVVRGMSLKTEFRVGVAMRSLAFGQDCKALLAREGLDSTYLFYSIQARSPEILALVDEAGHGTGRLNTDQLHAVEIGVPALPEQQAIAEVLGALDDKIAANTRLATTADALAGMDFARALGLPGVEEVAVGQCATTVLGGTPSRDELSYWTDGTIGWLNSGKANEARVLQPSEWITEEALSRSAAKVMPQRATVVAITGATLGQVARLEIAASGNQSLIGIWSDDPAMNDWIYFAIQREIPQLLRAATGAAQQHVNKRDLDALVLPTLGGADLAAWGRRVRPLLDVAAARERENLTLAGTRDALLPALMSGKLRVRDAEHLAETLT